MFIAFMGSTSRAGICMACLKLTTLGRTSDFTLLFIIPRAVLLSSIQPEAETLDFSTTHFREIFRKSSHQVNTIKGSVVKQSDNDDDVEGRSQKVLFQSNMRVFLQYSVISIKLSELS